MSAHKDKKRGTWMTYTRYKNWKGEKLIHQKRGFKTKHEALDYEAEFLRTTTSRPESYLMAEFLNTSSSPSLTVIS